MVLTPTNVAFIFLGILLDLSLPKNDFQCPQEC